MGRFRVALLQLSSAGLDQAANVGKGDEACRRAAATGADVALFPEMWSVGYRLPGRDEAERAEWEAAAIDTESAFVRHFRDLAAELNMAIAVTYLRRCSPRPRNALSLIDRHGEVLFTYDKVHTCDFDLEAACSPGERFEVAELDTISGPVLVGAMICFDREFPESARVLMLSEVEVVLTPNACTLDDLRLKQFEARAFENMIGVAMANYPAPEHNGHSVAFDGIAYSDDRPRDMKLVEAGEGEGIFLAEFDLEAMRAYRRREPWGARYRRPASYRRLLAPASSDDTVHVRWATAADAEAIEAFAADLHRYQDATEPDARVGAWARDLADGRHPNVAPEDFVLIVDDRGAIVASAVLISHNWIYGGVHLRVGQPELIAVRPEARGRGLAHRLMAALHERSASRGHDLLAIDGIPTFYRRFGYEMALPLRGEISVAVERVPRPGREMTVRAATEADLEFIRATYEASLQRYAVAALRDEREWRYDLRSRRADSQARSAMHVVLSNRGEPLAFIAIAPRLSGDSIRAVALEAGRGVRWEEVVPAVLAWLSREGARREEGDGGCRRIGLCLGADHPAYGQVADLDPRDEGAYAWYIRVPDLPSLVKRVAPSLERRLAEAGLGDRSADLRLAFSSGGLHLTVERGRLVEAAPWREPRSLRGVDKGVPGPERGDAVFPGLSFLPLVFGFRDLADLNVSYPDCFVRSHSAREWLEALFPKRPSNIWPVL